MAFSKFFAVVVLALAATCATCYDEQSAGLAVQDSVLSDSLLNTGSRSLLKRKKKKSKKIKKNKKRVENVAVITNDDGVVINQQVGANVDGDNNTIGGNFAGNFANVVVDTGDIFAGRKLMNIEGVSRELLAKKKKNKKKSSKKVKKKSKRATSVVQVDNNDGVAIAQTVQANVDGNNNTVGGNIAGGFTNTKFDVGDIFISP